MLDPASVRKNLPEFLLGARPNGPGMVEYNGARAGCPLIKGKDKGHNVFDGPGVPP
jgi:hypothetical protein